ncbi:MAG: hypothetical protein ATN31_05345 [Candidatus Epulonipiscioides saccharophilum]|nr:MAG: hypothetical protein ATN31_05345 [Epulopiscium sp. AS2M-Bin001]
MLKVGVIGIGTVAKVHINAIKDSEYAELVAICDINNAKMEQLYVPSKYTDIDEMLKSEKLDVVHICLPHYLHVPVVKKIAKSGINVFEEKPAGINLAEVKELFDLESIYGIKFGVCFQNRLNNTSIQLKEIIKSNRYGNVLGTKGIVTWKRKMNYFNEASWRGTINEAGGGVMLNQSIHTIDLLNYLVDDISAVFAKTANLTLPDVEIEDSVMASMDYKNIKNANAIFFATIGYCEDSSVNIEVVCQKAKFKIEDNTLYKIESGNKEIVCQNILNNDVKQYYGSAHQMAIEGFYKAIINNTQDYINIKEAVKSIAIIDVINKFSIENKKVTVLE